MEESNNLRILVIEDDPRMVELLRTGLWERGHSVITAATAEEGQTLADSHSFDVIVLDIGLPDRSGLTVAEHLRGRAGRPAIVMLTALNQETHVVCGLDAGADDYLTKPFSFPELAARITSTARRSYIASRDQFCFGPFRLKIEANRLFCDGVELHLTRSEYLLLKTLVLNSGEAVSRRRLTQAVWGASAMSHRALDTLVNNLREKLNVHQPGLIATIRGVGYSLAVFKAPRRVVVS